MQSITITIKNELGLHARPAMAFADMANQFQSDIYVSNDENHKLDGKNILHLIRLGALPETEIIVEAVGSDEGQALAELESLVQNDFQDVAT